MITLFTERVERERNKASAAVLVASWILVLAGVSFLAYAGYVTADAAIYQRIQSAKFASPKPSPISTTAHGRRTQLRKNVVPDDVIGEIRIPRLSMKAVVVEGDSPRILRRAVGHVPTTPLPGDYGNVALAGHRDTFFRPLRNIRLGDEVTFEAPGEILRYEVTSTQVVSPDEITVLAPSAGKELTLITCFPFSYVGAAPNRFVVRARQIAETP